MKKLLQILIIFLIVGFVPLKKKHLKVKHYIATYYSDYFNGRLTALGERFSNKGVTIATSNKKFLGKWITLVSRNGKRKRVYCDDLMNKRMKGIVDFDLTRKLMKFFSDKQKNYPGRISLEIAKVE